MGVPHPIAHLMPDGRYEYIPVETIAYTRHREHVPRMDTGEPFAFRPTADLGKRAAYHEPVGPVLQLQLGEISAVLHLVVLEIDGLRQRRAGDVPRLFPPRYVGGIRREQRLAVIVP